jgi:hypothetical protein
MPRKTFTAGDVLTAADVNLYLSNEITLTSSSATSYTVLTSDRYKTLRFTSASNGTVTIGTATAFQPGERVDIIRDGAGLVSITTDSTAVTLAGAGEAGTAFSISPQYEGVSLVCVDTNSYRVIGLPATGGQSGLTHIQTTTATGVASVSLNNVFTSTYKNYRVLIFCNTSTTSSIRIRMRAAGSDNTASSYFSNQFGRNADGASVSITENSGTSGLMTRSVGASDNFAMQLDVRNPQLAKKTIWSGNTYNDQAADQMQGGFVHTPLTAFDGFTLFPSAGNVNDVEIQVFGYKD